MTTNYPNEHRFRRLCIRRELDRPESGNAWRSVFADFVLGLSQNPGQFREPDGRVLHKFRRRLSWKTVLPGAYVQDTYRVTQKLTVNLGLRYELQGPWSERFNDLSYFNPAANQPPPLLGATV